MIIRELTKITERTLGRYVRGPNPEHRSASADESRTPDLLSLFSLVLYVR